MLKTVVLDLPYQETWLEFDATGKNTKITNLDQLPIETAIGARL